jgi:hypothetical protein
MTDPADQSLAALLEASARDLEAAEERRNGETLEWSIGGLTFATMGGDRAEFRLDPAVATAALRTPDTSPSPRGADWVAFSPASLDRHALDRAEAWLASAWRRADGET